MSRHPTPSPAPDGDGAPTAVLYLRVSTPSQVKTDYDPEGISIPAQREACQRKAAQMGVQIVGEYVEPGRTATSMDKRPEFQAMLERIRRQRDVAYVIVYKLSRMNRNRIDDALVLTSLRKYKTTLVSATESIDETPVGQLMHGILAAFNEYRSAEDGADIRYKMGEKAKRGGTLGRAAVGYLNVRERFEGREVRTVIVDPERGPFVHLAFELYATGKYSLRRLADELTDRGFRTKAGPKSGGAITDSTLAVMLRNRYYLGIVTYNGAEYPGRHEPLVTQELFDQVQRMLDASGVSGERRRVHEHYLKGSLWCGRCHQQEISSRLILTKATGRLGVDYFYFLCRGRQEGFCDLPHLPLERVEDKILNFWQGEHLDEQFVTDLEASMTTTLAEMQTSTRLLHEQLTAELAKLDRQEENLLDLAADGSLDTAKVRSRITRLQAQRREIQKRLDQGDDRLEQGAAVLRIQLDLLRQPGKLYRQLPDKERRILNQAMFERIYLNEARGEIHVAERQYAEPVRDLMDDGTELAEPAGEATGRPNGQARGRRRPGDRRQPPRPRGRARRTGRTAEAAAPNRRLKNSRPAEDGGPDLDTKAGWLRSVQLDGGWSKTAMVGDEGIEPATSSV